MCVLGRAKHYDFPVAQVHWGSLEMKAPRCKQRGISIKKGLIVHLGAVADILCLALAHID
jgi:hypothetical protein